MTTRPLPAFLKHGDKALGFPQPTPEKRLRAMMGMPEQEAPESAFVSKRG
jgi:hypothetical protein